MARNLIRDNIVGSGSIYAGIKGRGGRTVRPQVGNLAETGGFPELQIDGGRRANDRGAGVCGAMSEQHSTGGPGNEPALQKLVRLVGCCNPSARNAPWKRPRPIARKP